MLTTQCQLLWHYHAYLLRPQALLGDNWNYTSESSDFAYLRASDDISYANSVLTSNTWDGDRFGKKRSTGVGVIPITSVSSVALSEHRQQVYAICSARIQGKTPQDTNTCLVTWDLLQREEAKHVSRQPYAVPNKAGTPAVVAEHVMYGTFLPGHFLFSYHISVCMR